MTRQDYDYIIELLLETIYTCSRIASDEHTGQWARDRAATAQESAREAFDKLREVQPL
jgi:hypothetical protein